MVMIGGIVLGKDEKGTVKDLKIEIEKEIIKQGGKQDGEREKHHKQLIDGKAAEDEHCDVLDVPEQGDHTADTHGTEKFDDDVMVHIVEYVGLGGDPVIAAVAEADAEEGGGQKIADAVFP